MKTSALTAVHKNALVGSLILLIALIAAWMLVLSPRSDAIAAANEEVEAAESSNQALRNQIQTLKLREEQLPALRETSKALDRRFPPTAEQAKLFKMVTAAAAEAGIAPQHLTSMQMDPPAAVGSAASARLPGMAAPVSSIAGQKLTINVSGSPSQIRAFVANLEKLPRAFAASTISLAQQSGSQEPSENASTAADAQTVTITGDMFLLPTVTDPTKAGATKAGSTPAEKAKAANAR